MPAKFANWGRFGFTTTALWMALLFVAHAAAAPPQQPQYSHQRSEAAGRAQLDRFRKQHPTRASWERVATDLRRHILSGAGLSKLPKRTPLNPIVHSRREHDGYSVENVALETLPGFFATGNVYRPTRGNGAYAAILCPHGHIQDKAGKLCGRVHPDTQKRCAVLARLGAVVMAIDMVGAVDATQTEHRDPRAFALQLWDNMRALDYLTSLPEVDGKRIGVSGSSGGGSQTVMLTALDPRVAVSVPVVMVSAHFDGGCSCESGMPVFKGPHHETNLAQVAALAAPRPQLLISCGADWTKNTPQVELPYIREIYALYGKPDLAEGVHLADEKHDYGPSKRQAAYRFLARHLALNPDNVPHTADGNVDEAFVTLEPAERLRVFDEEHPRPEHAVQGSEAVAKALVDAQ